MSDHLLDLSRFDDEDCDLIVAWKDECVRQARLEELGRFAVYGASRDTNHVVAYLAHRMADLIERAGDDAI